MVAVNDWRVRTPVAFFIFNRPETAAKVFEAIRQVHPPLLLVVADGPRANRFDERGKCQAVRAIIEQVDWPCEVLKNYSEINLGCGRRVSSGLAWVFERVEEAIILEDDCLPHPTFFRFCEELLQRYRGDYRIMHVNGVNFQTGLWSKETSYYFSRYPHVWGWASWRRAWHYYDESLTRWAAARYKSVYLRQFESPIERRFWRTVWDAVCTGEIDTWDYQWAFACMIRCGLAITPRVNLVSNVGFGPQSSHTRVVDVRSRTPVEPMAFPLIHPPSVLRDAAADAYLSRFAYSGPQLPLLILRRAKALVRRLLSV